MEPLWWEYLVFFGGVTALSAGVNRIILYLSNRTGILNHDADVIRWSATSKPALGGISFYATFLVSLGVCWWWTRGSETGTVWTLRDIGIIGATTIGFLAGWADDAFRATPWLKFVAQISSGVLLVATGTVIEISPYYLLNAGLTILWVVAVMNSINMLDNMDAVTTVVSIFILLSALAICLLSPIHDSFLCVILIGSLAGLIGFLFFNWNPSKMFMGDSGSQFLGVILSVAGVHFLWNAPEIAVQSPSRQILIMLMAFIIPVSDTFTVIVNRLKRGKSPFMGGKDHTTHNLSYLGFSDRQVALLFAGISGLSFLFIYIITNFIASWSHWYTGIFLAYFLTVFVLLYRCTQLKKAKERFNAQQD